MNENISNKIITSPKRIMKMLTKELPPEDTPHELRINAPKTSATKKESVASKIVKAQDTSDISNNTLSLSNFTSLSFGLDDSEDDLLLQNRGQTYRDKLRQKRAENPYVMSDSTLKTPAPTENTIDDIGLSMVSFDESINISEAKIEIRKKRKRNRTEIEFLNLTNAISKLNEDFVNIDSKEDDSIDLEMKNNRNSKFKKKRKSVHFDLSPVIRGIPKVNEGTDLLQPVESNIHSSENSLAKLSSEESESPKGNENNLEESPKRKRKGLKSPIYRERGLESPKSKEKDLESSKRKEKDLESPTNKMKSLKSPKSIENNLEESPKRKEKSLESSENREKDLESPKRKNKGLESPENKEKGLKSPKNKEKSLDTTKNKEKGSESPKRKEKDLESSKGEKGLESLENREKDLASPKGKNKGLESPKNKEKDLESPKRKEKVFESPKNKENNLNETPKSKKKSLESPKRKKDLESPVRNQNNLVSISTDSILIGEQNSKENENSLLMDPNFKLKNFLDKRKSVNFEIDDIISQMKKNISVIGDEHQNATNSFEGIENLTEGNKSLLKKPTLKLKNILEKRKSVNFDIDDIISQMKKNKSVIVDEHQNATNSFEGIENLTEGNKSLLKKPTLKLKNILEKRKSVNFDIDDIISQMKKNKSVIVDEHQNSLEGNENLTEVNRSVTKTVGTRVDANAENTSDTPMSKRSIYLSPNSIRKKLESSKSVDTTQIASLNDQVELSESGKRMTSTFSEAFDVFSPPKRLKSRNRLSLSPKSVEKQLQSPKTISLSLLSSPRSSTYHLGSSKSGISSHLSPILKSPEKQLISPKSMSMNLRSSPVSTSYHSTSLKSKTSSRLSHTFNKSPEKQLKSPSLTPIKSHENHFELSKTTHMNLRSSPVSTNYHLTSPKSKTSSRLSLTINRSPEKQLKSPSLTPIKSQEKQFESSKITHMNLRSSPLSTISPESPKLRTSSRLSHTLNKSPEKQLRSPKSTSMILRSSPVSTSYHSKSPNSRIHGPKSPEKHLKSPKSTLMTLRASPKSTSYTSKSPKSETYDHMSHSHKSPEKQVESPKTTQMSLRSSPKSASFHFESLKSSANNLSSNQLELHKSLGSSSVSSEIDDSKSNNSNLLSSDIHLKSTGILRNLFSPKKSPPSKLSVPLMSTSNTSNLTNIPQSNDDKSKPQKSTNNTSTMSLKLVTEEQNRSLTVEASPDRNANANNYVFNTDGRMAKSPVKGVYENSEMKTLVSEKIIHKSEKELSLHERSKHVQKRQLETTETSSNSEAKRSKMTKTENQQIYEEGLGNLIEEELNSLEKISSPKRHNDLNLERDENYNKIVDFESLNSDTSPSRTNLSNTRTLPVFSPVARSTTTNTTEQLLTYPTTSTNFEKLFDKSLQGTVTINRNKKRCRNTKGSPKPSTSKSNENKSGQSGIKEFLERLKSDPPSRKPEPDLFQEMIKKPKELLEINKKYEKKKETPKKKNETKTKTKTNLPPKMNAAMFQHFLKHKLTKEGSEVLQEIVGEIFTNLAEDLQVIMTSSNDKLINKNHLFLLMKQLKIVSNWEELYALTEELLPANEWKKLVPIQYAHNKVFPQPPREKRGGGS